MNFKKWNAQFQNIQYILKFILIVVKISIMLKLNKYAWLSIIKSYIKWNVVSISMFQLELDNLIDFIEINENAGNQEKSLINFNDLRKHCLTLIIRIINEMNLRWFKKSFKIKTGRQFHNYLNNILFTFK